MTNRLTFAITFHTPFRVATGFASAGRDAAVDQADPLPSGGMKGVMRAAASRILSLSQDDAHEVFGSVAQPCPWSWDPVRFTEQPGTGVRYRVAIDPETGTALRDHIQMAEVHLSNANAEFSITQTGLIRDDRLEHHRLILTCAARAVHSLGSQRRRGLGWVTVTGGVPLDVDRLNELPALGGH